MSRGISIEMAKSLGIEVPGVGRTRGRNKYGVAPPARRTFNGKVYASRAEAIRAQELADYLGFGGCADIVEQPRLWLGVRENVYVPDFLVIGGGANQSWYEDVKGVETAAFRKNIKLWERYGRLPLRVLTRNRSGWTMKIITPKGHG